jgi:hypothetical protein
MLNTESPERWAPRGFPFCPLPSALCLALLGGCAGSQGPEGLAPARARSQGQLPRDYGSIIGRDAVSDSGLFTLHRAKKKVYYEIPGHLLGRDMLLISRVAGSPANLSPFVNAGSKVAEQVVRWERHDDKILLRTVSYQADASDTLPVYRSVQSNNFAPIVYAFDIEAFNPADSAMLIAVNDLFEKDVPAIGGLSRSQRDRFKVRSLDANRTFINYARSYPLNVDVRHTLTFQATEPPSQARTGTLSIEMHQSMVLLPGEPMRRRYADPRLGWITLEQIDFGLDEQKAATRRYIQRWRLEPKDRAAYARGELVEPVKPIVYYLDPATPAKWRPYIRRGIEDWQVAFEAAGFKNAIIARDPPSFEEDPEFNPEDVRYSTVRWVASMTRNALGPRVADPRSGEILESDVIWYHNHMRSYRNRLLIETGAANAEARSLDLPEELLGEAVRAVIAHEVGHSIGLPHNMIASSAYPVDSLRSPAFTHEMGIAPTIMDYARQNYIAQPGDGDIRFIRKIGPYDRYAINWGYRVITDAQHPEEEKPTLDRRILEHAGDPVFRFGRQRGGLLVDPRAQTEDLGDDPVKASSYAVANLKRVLPNLLSWTSNDGEDYADLEELYAELLFQWNRYMGHVLALVGGMHEDIKTTDQDGPVYEPVNRARQRNAVQFLVQEVFETPTWLNDEATLRRIEHAGAVDPARMQRLIEIEVFDPEDCYSLLEFLDDVRAGIWREIRTADLIDTYRRNLQRGYLERMAYLMTEEVTTPTSRSAWRTPVDVSQSDIRPFVRGQLIELRGDVSRAAQRTRHRATQYHLEDVVVRIDRILEGKKEGEQ